MEKILYNKDGQAVAFIANDYHDTIYLWEGLPVAYLYEGENVYGFNGRHLGWIRDEILFNHAGERVGFTYTTCPVGILQAPAKGKRIPLDEMKPRWGAPIIPKLAFKLAAEDLGEFLKQGLAVRYRPKSATDSAAPSPAGQRADSAATKPPIES
ncbi:MAG: 4-fold beta flower protein [Thermodesulfobacteriota bacterium]